MRIEDREVLHRLHRWALTALVIASAFTPALFIQATRAEAFSAADVYRSASDSVVLIFGFEDSGAGSSGTGTILSQDGLILTNNHVITSGEGGRLFSNIVVYFKPTPISGDNEQDLTQPFMVDVIARDADLDLALLRVKNAPPGLRPMEFANSEEVDIGERVAAIGHPGGGGLWTLTTGTVSSKRREQDRDIFQTDAAINPGNSGGPLLDEYARLVGVNTFVRRVNDAGLPLEGLNYSLRSSLALSWVNRQPGMHVVAVSRGFAAASAAVPAPRPATPAEGPAPIEPLAVEPRIVPTPAPPATLESSPAPQARPQAAVPEPNARVFTALDGTEMYGVPNVENDLADSLNDVRKAYAELTKRREQSINEMEDLFDDYDNF